MDEHGSAGTADRPLTRRELRARDAVERGASDAPADDDARDVATAEGTELPPDGSADDRAPHDGTADHVATHGGAPDEGPWREAVDWSLHQTLPRELPPEPEVDDVRWDPVPRVGGPVRVSVLPGSSSGPAPAVPQAGSATAPPDPAAPGPAAPDPAGLGPATAGRAAPNGAGPAPAAPDLGAPAPGPEPRTPAPWDGLLHGEPVPVPAPAGVGAPGPAGEELPTLDDLLARRPDAPAGPAETGWRGTVRRISGGIVAPAPGRAEQEHRDAVRRVQRSLDGPKTIVVINPKGGAHKTTTALMLAATFGLQRGGYTLAWDNNETRGTLGWRSQRSAHSNTAVNLLQDLDRFADPGSSRVGDLDNYVRAQGDAQFDVLASDEDAASAASIDSFAFRSLHRTLSRFYRVMVVDTGNNMRASNWQAALEVADQVVIVSTVREDTSQSAAWAVDALRATGHADVVRHAVTVLSAPAPRRDDRLAARLHDHFGALTRAVLDVPYDPALVDGRPLEYPLLAPGTREAWLRVTATVADGL